MDGGGERADSRASVDEATALVAVIGGGVYGCAALAG